MTKNVNKKIAALAMAAVMGVGGIGMAKLANMATTASADTGTHSSYALHASTGTIGINQHATVDVSSAAPATLTLNNVAAGQYMIVAKVIEATGDYYWIDLSASVDGNYSYLNESEYYGAFIGTVTVDSNSTIELSTWSGATLTVEVWLQPLAIGQFNDYFLSDIQISANNPREIMLEGISGRYIVSLEVYGYMPASAEIMVNGVPVTKNPKMYGAWTGEYNLTGVSSLVISTTNPEAISVNLTLRKYITVSEELPMEEYAKFSMYESQTFYYEAEDTGYYTLNYASNVENAEFSLVFKTNPNDLEGATIQGNNYPVYMEAFETYYVTATYVGIPGQWENVPDTAGAVFTVDTWNTPKLYANMEAEYVPVSAAGEEVAEIPMNVAAGTYELNLINIPFYVLNDDAYTITAHFGTQEVELEYGYAQIEITNETSIWFTTDFTEGFTAGATITTPEVRETITLGKLTDINVPANGSAIYYIENVEEGYFNITLSNLGDAKIVVESTMFSYPIISEGQTFGTFGVLTYGDETATAVLYFYNNGDTDANFQALVNPVNNVVINLGELKGIELASGETKVYYLENLAEGLYSIALANAAGIEVTANGMVITDGKFTTNYDGESVALRFTNTGANTAVFEVTVTMIANGVITLGEEMYIFMDASSNVKTYVVEGLEEGKEYKITLSDYVTEVTVMMGTTTVIEAGATTGTFVATGTSVTLTIAANTAFLYFSVLVTD